jgi:hypothetical protein
VLPTVDLYKQAASLSPLGEQSTCNNVLIIFVIVTIDNCELLFVIVSKGSVTDDGLDKPERNFLKSNPLNLHEA